MCDVGELLKVQDQMRQTTRLGVQQPVLSPGLTCSGTQGQSVAGTTPVPGSGRHTPSAGFSGIRSLSEEFPPASQ